MSFCVWVVILQHMIFGTFFGLQFCYLEKPDLCTDEDKNSSSAEREVPQTSTLASATSSLKSKPYQPTRKVSRQTDEREKWLQDGVQSEKASRRPSRSVIRGEAKPPSESSGSERTSATDDILEDKPVLEDFDNKGKKIEYIFRICSKLYFDSRL